LCNHGFILLEQLFDAATRFDTEKLAAIVHDDVRFEEKPNLVNPSGSVRDKAAALAGFEKGRELLSAQSYEVHSKVQQGDTIAARATWRGTLAATGKQLTAHIATFTQVRDGRIYRHATYDCYEPFS
jgi:ketosteroid isomerase-like protein